MKVSNISKGDIIIYKKEPYQVMDKDFFKLGRGRGNLKAKLKNVKDGSVIRQTFNSELQVQQADLATKKLQFLYKDGQGMHFMDPVTFEQIDLSGKISADSARFLQEGSDYSVIFWEGSPITIKIPLKVTLKVTRSEEAVKGDTVSGATKEIELETGLKVKTPLFIRQGERIIINTESGEYVSRAGQT